VQKGQIALGVGTIILALALYFGGKTVVKKEQTAIVKTESFSFEQYEQQQTAKLLPAEKSQLAAITEALKAVKPADTATFKKLYLKTSDFWKLIISINLHKLIKPKTCWQMLVMCISECI
jgi:hypothetical protein